MFCQKRAEAIALALPNWLSRLLSHSSEQTFSGTFLAWIDYIQ
jgi:hypothetical protein